jgi:hypothetical protein
MMRDVEGAVVVEQHGSEEVLALALAAVEMRGIDAALRQSIEEALRLARLEGRAEGIGIACERLRRAAGKVADTQLER